MQCVFFCCVVRCICVCKSNTTHFKYVFARAAVTARKSDSIHLVPTDIAFNNQLHMCACLTALHPKLFVSSVKRLLSSNFNTVSSLPPTGMDSGFELFEALGDAPAGSTAPDTGGTGAVPPPPAPHQSQKLSLQQQRTKNFMFKECKLCLLGSEIKKNQVYCTINNCAKIVNNSENHAKNMGELDFYRMLKTMDDVEPFRKYLFAYKRATGGGVKCPGRLLALGIGCTRTQCRLGATRDS